MLPNRKLIAVSIHAPVKVRLASNYYLKSLWSFNSRTREGATSCSLVWYIAFLFQFTHPWRCDAFFKHFFFEYNSFNSRTREGATELHFSKIKTKKFQFTHPWRCDLFIFQAFQNKTGFNSRTREGATHNLK